MADLFKQSSRFFDTEPLCHSVSIVFIDLVEETEHVVSDVGAANTEGLADVVDEARSFFLVQYVSVESAYLFEFFGRVKELIPTY